MNFVDFAFGEKKWIGRIESHDEWVLQSESLLAWGGWLFWSSCCSRCRIRWRKLICLVS